MKKTILYAVGVVAVIAAAAFVVVGCDGDMGERSETMDAFLDKFHYNTKKRFTITYDGNGNTDGVAPIDDKSPYDSGWTVVIKDQGTLIKNGYMFSGWNSNKEGGGKYGFGMVAGSYGSLKITENVTLYAQWDNTTTFAVEVVSLLPGSYVYGAGSYRPGATVIITAVPLDGWKFQNWTTASKGVSFADAESASTSFIMPENKVTVTATFAVISGDISSFTDSRDNKTYITVTIGEQTWMARNLDYLNDMTPVDSSWCYDDDPDNCNMYGRLYTWDAAVKVCPAGWRLPDTEDWRRLVNAAGGKDVAGKKLKATRGWGSDYGTDDYGFSALPGGSRNTDGSFFYAGNYGNWWTATENGGFYAYYRRMYYNDEYVNEYDNYKSYGFSVRCLRD